MKRAISRRAAPWLILLGLAVSAWPALGQSGSGALAKGKFNCDQNGILCTPTFLRYNRQGRYIGHDEPSLIFYSSRRGSGNSSIYQLVLPKDPPTLPRQSGGGGTFNFQLHPAFWVGMALCDPQSAPNPHTGPATPCRPDSDANVFASNDPSSPRYLGRHPGTAFLELQFYPPRWVTGASATQWAAAVTIDSYNVNFNTNQVNSTACQNLVGLEPVNFAFLTHSGFAEAPANPVWEAENGFAGQSADPQETLFMNPGDHLLVSVQDSPDGLLAAVWDETTGQFGFMTAGAANGFGEVAFDPTGSTCDNLPYDFHPMYATSRPETRVVWAAHSYNVAFSDELGHFELCGALSATGEGGPCGQAGADEGTAAAKLDTDDLECFDNFGDPQLVPVIGCVFTEFDFDGDSYRRDWPGSNDALSATEAQRLLPTPIRFTTPLFWNQDNDRLDSFPSVAFETDLPAIEELQNCNPLTGANCSNPPVTARFYPIFTTTLIGDSCWWQLGGAGLAGTKMSFGGTSQAEYGPLLSLEYPTPQGPLAIFENYHNTLQRNPCPGDHFTPPGAAPTPAASEHR